nr:MAG TPA: hypothetical protein [Caudoviricetes sp.]
MRRNMNNSLILFWRLFVSKTQQNKKGKIQ